jgi:hypothetical protein
VVARAGELELLEEHIEVGLLEERRAVDAGEHLAVGVSAPVGPGDRLQLDCADALRARRVRPAAEVCERAVGVKRDRLDAFVADQVLDELDLVVLVFGLEAR